MENTKLIKVLHVLNTGAYSGAENVAITMIDACKSEVEGIYCSKEGFIENILKEHKISFKTFPQMTPNVLKDIIKDTQPNIIHAHDFTAGIMCLLTCTKIPIINHIHNNSPWIKQYNKNSFVYGASCLRYDKILTVSPSVMDEFVFGKWFKKKTVVVGNPINIKRIQNQIDCGNEEKTYDIAFLGRFSNEKNPHLFLSIITEIKKKKTDLKVVMIGDGELKGEIENQIKQDGLDGSIWLTGFQKNPYQYLNKARILLMPSKWEGYGLAAVEALTLGLPVACSNVGGLPTIVNDRCGKVCKEKQEYVDEIVKLLEKKDYYLMKSKAAVERAGELDNLEDYKNMILGIYDEVLK